MGSSFDRAGSKGKSASKAKAAPAVAAYFLRSLGGPLRGAISTAPVPAHRLRALHEAWGGRGEAIRKVALSPDGVPVNRALFEASVARIKALDLADRFPTERRRQAWTLTE